MESVLSMDGTSNVVTSNIFILSIHTTLLKLNNSDLAVEYIYSVIYNLLTNVI